MVEVCFEVETPLGFSVRCTQQHWDFIVSEKHPVMIGQEEAVRQTLKDPDEVRKSRKRQSGIAFLQETRKKVSMYGDQEV